MFELPAAVDEWDSREYGTTTCSECGADCLDPDDGVGISRGSDPICSDCAAME